jgi:hypothetical protein
MSGEFKHFDKMFSAKEIADTRNRWSTLLTLDKWPHEVKHWGMSDIRYAVYMAPDHLDWQLFRVALKGLPTDQKLGMLSYRLTTRVTEPSEPNWLLEFIRADNYIGALRRGGQLNEALEVVK